MDDPPAHFKPSLRTEHPVEQSEESGEGYTLSKHTVSFKGINFVIYSLEDRSQYTVHGRETEGKFTDRKLDYIIVNPDRDAPVRALIVGVKYSNHKDDVSFHINVAPKNGRAYEMLHAASPYFGSSNGAPCIGGAPYGLDRLLSAYERFLISADYPMGSDGKPGVIYRAPEELLDALGQKNGFGGHAEISAAMQELALDIFYLRAPEMEIAPDSRVKETATERLKGKAKGLLGIQ